MPKLDSADVRELKSKIRSLSREAAIQVLVGIVELMGCSVSLRSIEFPKYIDDGVKLSEAKNGRDS